MLERLIARLGELGLSPPTEDKPLLETLLEGAVRSLIAETGQSTLPKELEPAMLDMASGEYLAFRKSAGRLEEFEEEQVVRQMSQGDTSITYAVEFGQISSVEVLIEKLKTPPAALLNQWRRMRW